jgi:hypothetical protein
MVKIVFRDATPRVAGTFAAQPKTMYRWSSHYLRVEELPDAKQDIHALTIMNQRDTWMINLVNSSGRHIVDSAERYDIHAPIIGWVKNPLTALEYGCEIEFMQENGIEPTLTVLGEKQLLQYRVQADDIIVQLLVDPKTGKPSSVGVIERGTPTYLVRYDAYESDLNASAELFSKPSDITFEEEK